MFFIAIIFLFLVITSAILISKFAPSAYIMKTNSPAQAFNSSALEMSKGSILLTNIPKENCYWVRYTYSDKGHVLEIREYKSPNKDCYGELVNVTEIPLKSGANIGGDTSCICGGKDYVIKKIESSAGIDYFNIGMK